MKSKRGYLSGLLAAVFMLIIILDCKTALEAAAIATEMCIKTVIPSLFPFFFLTGVITSTLSEPLGRICHPIGKLFKIPAGAESTLVLGLLGGYPIGAQAVTNIHSTGLLDKKAAQRMLSFCNNPGPAFIFGMIGCLFDSPIVPWAIWGIVIIASFMTAWIQPAGHTILSSQPSKNKTKTLDIAIKAMAKVCSWVILFRVLIIILNRWILWMLPSEITVLLTGFLELTNGCTALSQCSDNVFRFCSVSAMLCFGGICVTLQTVGVAGNLINIQYFLGKLFQATLSLPLSYIAALLLFSQKSSMKWIIASTASLCVSILIGYILHKNNTGNPDTDVI